MSRKYLSDAMPRQLRELEDTVRGFVNNAVLPMCSLVVCKYGESILNVHCGKVNGESSPPPSDNTIYRLFSLTKPVIAVAIMILWERDLISLDDPVEKFIPGFKNQQVADRKGFITTVRRPCSIRNILSMTSGISAFYRGDSIGAQRLAELKRYIEEENGWNTLKVADEIGKIPLDFHPGEGWFYGQSMDVAGAIIEAVSGKKLGVFLNEEIFSPLGMDDTAFFVPLYKRNRLCGFFQQNQHVAGWDLSVGGDNSLEPVTLRRYEIPFIPPEFEQGGDGLLSTPQDYMRFMNMLLDGQKSDSRQLLQPESLYLLTEPRIPIKGIPLLEGYSYGFGLRILREPGILWRKGKIGEYGWYGHGGSWCCAERKTGITAIFFTQLLPSPHLEVIPQIYSHLFS